MTEIEEMIQARGKEWLGRLPESAKANLIRLTAAYSNNHVSWQVVANEQASEDDLEEYSCIFTEVLADFQTATGDETVVTVKSPDEAEETKALAIPIYP